MRSRKVVYTFKLPGEQEEVFVLEYDAKTLKRYPDDSVDYPDWTRLQFHQCPHCPLSTDDTPRCPLAESIAEVVKQFQHIISFDELYLQVESDERVVTQKATAQRALGSFMGVVMAVSGCPHTAYFKPMARFHLPLASEEETIYRSSSMYLLAQYFCAKEGKKADYSLKGLDKIYRDIQVVNTAIVDRLRDASSADSSVNAVIMLDMYARIMPYVIEESLEDVRYLFEPYFISEKGEGDVKAQGPQN